MSVELEAVAEFLTGSHTAVETLPWRLLGSEDLRVVRRWAGEALALPAERRLLRELRRVIRDAAQPDEEPVATPFRPALLQAHRRRESAAVPARVARLLLELCREASDVSGRRDCAVLSLMLLAGLRRQEVVGLRRSDYEDAEARLEVRTRRGGRRSVLLEGECRNDLEHWLAERGSGGGPLFLAFDACGTVLPRGIAAPTVNRILTRRSTEAGIDGLTPRLLRDRFLWQLRAGTRQGTGQRCRYYLAEDGQPGWALSSLSAV